MKHPSSQGVVKSIFVLLFTNARSSNDGSCGSASGGGGTHEHGDQGVDGGDQEKVPILCC